jgi:homogentisate 1,2-dioxygenase
MLERIARGELPKKPHTAFRDGAGRLRYEECHTRAGFDGPYTIVYHERRPHEARESAARHGWLVSEGVPGRPLLRRHYRGSLVASSGAPPISARTPLLENADVVVGVVTPCADDPVYFANGDADDLYYVHEGGGVLRSVLGDLPFRAGDYVCVPRGILHRFLLDGSERQFWLSIECLGGLAIPESYRNRQGQLRMDAPYTHRDFRAPELSGPLDEGLCESVVKRGGRFFGFTHPASPLDVVGWDGTVYPFAFAITDFQPRVGQIHLPPTVHGTFAARGALICSFVPRPLDFHPDAVPCPYPHSSVDVDELIFYCRGNFTSRRGVGPASLSHHPAGIAHGPHPGAYEASLGVRHTDELAVMLDCFAPLVPTRAALELEDPGYHQSFVDPGGSHSTG